MKHLILLCCIVLSLLNLRAQESKGRVVMETFLAPSIKGNHGGEDAMRRVTVYLPPGYEKSTQRYPVIYFLHGFTRNDSFCISDFRINELLDKAIANKQIRPVILVLPNSYTTFKGSFYTNSPLTGNWSDYIAKDVVQFIDKKFRTIPDRDSRGLCGHSMGGNGSVKIGMLYSDVFSSVYALSPARLDWGEGLTIGSKSYKTAQSSKSLEELSKDFFALEVTDLARTYSPNENKPPFYADYPFEVSGDSMTTNTVAFKKWDANIPINMIDDHIAALKSLHAFKLDWGRNDRFGFIPVACLKFSKKLESLGIAHYAEEYIGDHGDRIGGIDGRIYTELLPFFNTYLLFTRPAQDSIQYSRQLIDIEQQLMNDVAKGDTTKWGTYLARQFFIVTEDGTHFDRAAFLSTFRPLPPGYIGHIDVIKPKLTFYENTAVINYVADEYLNLMGQPIHTTYSTSNTYVRTDTSWKMIASQVFEIPQLPHSIKIPATVLKKYTGVYQMNDTITCTVSLQHDTLYIQKKGRPKEALLPETESVFMRAVDTRGRKIFMPDEKGTMLMRERRNGQDVVWKRIR